MSQVATIEDADKIREKERRIELMSNENQKRRDTKCSPCSRLLKRNIF